MTQPCDSSQDGITGDTTSPSYTQLEQTEGMLDRFLSSIGDTVWSIQRSGDPQDPSKFNVIAYPRNGSPPPLSQQDCESNAQALQQILDGDPDNTWILSCSYNTENGGYDLVVSLGHLAATNFDQDAASNVLNGVQNDPDNPGAKGISQYNPATDSYDLYVNAPEDPEYS